MAIIPCASHKVNTRSNSALYARATRALGFFGQAVYTDNIPPQGGYEGNIRAHHEHTNAALDRLSRAIGHLNAVKAMIQDGRDCSEVLIQLSAVRAELAGVSKVVLKDHLTHCIVEAVKEGDDAAMERLLSAVDKLL